MKNSIHVGLNKLSKLYYKILTKFYIKRVDIIIDIGCGTRPQTFFVPYIHNCIDPYKPYIDAIANSTIDTLDRIWIFNQGDWVKSIEIMKSGNINSVFLLDVIEHLDKDESLKLLKETEKLVSDQIIVYTPYGYFDQVECDGKDAWGMDGVEFQKHKSGWYPEDFGEGWKVWVLPYAHIVNSMNEPIKPSSAILAIYNKR